LRPSPDRIGECQVQSRAEFWSRNADGRTCQALGNGGDHGPVGVRIRPCGSGAGPRI
jgi:hypothetical protein